MITITNLSKSYQSGKVSSLVLKNISFSINDGEFVVILGPSGSGKTTLLNCLSGLEYVDSGSIEYDENDITKFNDKELRLFRRNTTAYIFQAYYLMSSLTILANIKMGANLASIDDVSPIIEAVGLKGKEKHYPAQLSGGEMQRVSIARALAKKPKVLFCDEPTGALDEDTGKAILKYLIKLQEQEKFTIVMVTHNQNIADLAQKIIRMNSGVIKSIEENQPKTVEEIGW